MSFINAKIIGSNQKRGEAGQIRGHREYVMSRSQIVLFADNPAKWLARFGAEEESSRAMDFGSLVDCLATTPDILWDKFAVTPSTYLATPKKKGDAPEDKPWNKNATFCKEWEEQTEAQGKTVISGRMWQEAQAALSALKSNEAILELLDCSKRQVLITADWQDEATGLKIPFSALLDLVPDVSSPVWGKTLADLKTARSGNPATWARVCDDSGYDVQASLYMDLYIAATGEDRTDFVHVVQENVFPFHVTTPPPCMSSEFLDWGRMKYKKALRLYAQCLATGIWPSYATVGMVYGNTQIISPDGLWNYRQGVGMAEFKMPAEKETLKSSQETDYLAGA